MGITGAIYKGFTFDGVNSKDYGIYITGEAVYNAPERDVDVIAIPGRNGAFVKDNGRFENITVTYPAGTFGETQPDFAENIKTFRNIIASKVGYCRLTDDYNTGEYRMAVYKSGLEASPEAMGRAGQFNLTFECKPQRFLTSGEAATSKANNSTITNPTLFEACPLIEFNASGSGEINIGSRQIKVLNSYIGNIPLNLSANDNEVTIVNSSSFNSGDIIKFNGVSINIEYASNGQSWMPYVTARDGLNGTEYLSREGGWGITPKSTEMTFTAGTSSTVTQSLDVKVVRQHTTPATEETQTFTLSVAYDGTDKFTVTWTIPTYTVYPTYRTTDRTNYVGSVNSTKSSLEDVDIYVDLDIGEAYSIDSDENVVSLNNFVNLGGELPVLAPGNTTITYDNTISNFKITPRWWII